MTVKGIERSIPRKDPQTLGIPAKNDLVQSFTDQPVKLSLPDSDELPRTRDTSMIMYLKYMLPCDLMKLALSIFLLCALTVFIRQSKYTVINIQQTKTVSTDGDESLENTRYDLVDGQLVNEENYKYNIVIVDEIFEFSDTMQCSKTPEAMRFDCHPENGASELTCTDRGCCWDTRNQQVPVKRVPLNTPYCYYPEGWGLYKHHNATKDGNDFTGFLEQNGKSIYKNDVPLIKMESTSMDSSILRVKIYDAANKRYEPPWPVRPIPTQFSQTKRDAHYKFHVDDTKLGFKVERVDDGTALFDSIGIGGFIFADQFLQISSLLPSHNIYGIGEHRSSLKLNTSWQLITLFNKDQPTTENANLYGSHPFYMIIEDSGKAHGVLFLNSNAMEVILQPRPAITFRTIGGIFDMYFFLGPTPADVVRQYSEIVGKPFLPPYWSLGFHLCRFGYGSLEKTKDVWNRTRAAGIPFDTQWNDLGYM